MESVEFRPDGSLASLSNRNPDGSELGRRYEYDEAGNLTCVRFERGGATERYEYDRNGRLQRKFIRQEGADDRVLETCEYANDGRMTKIFHIDRIGIPAGTRYLCQVEGSKQFFSAEGAATMTTLHNENGKPEQVMFRDPAGRLLNAISFLYDNDGNLLEESQNRPADTMPPEITSLLPPAQQLAAAKLLGFNKGQITSHKYDPGGRRVETRSSIGALSSSCEATTYNEEGDPVMQTTDEQDTRLNIDDDGNVVEVPSKKSVSRRETRFRYEYDDHGNWIVKTVEGRGGETQESVVSTIERRAISYFD